MLRPRTQGLENGDGRNALFSTSIYFAVCDILLRFVSCHSFTLGRVAFVCKAGLRFRFGLRCDDIGHSYSSFILRLKTRSSRKLDVCLTAVVCFPENIKHETNDA